MSAAVEISGLSLKLGSFALRDFSLALDAGEILVILGPNGAGKSVSLEAIAGFHRLLGGRIVIAGRDVTRLPPERRHISLLFQNFGLFPHLSVAQNVAFGRPRRQGGADPARLLARFGIAPLAAERPDTLSPGQKQRVALARAFAARPELFLFDEPFSAIDLPTRAELRDELKAFLREVGVPAIFVTHDRSDADALADRLAILVEGRIVQTGAAAEVLGRPATTAVARFLGVENILPGRTVGRANGVAHIAVGDAVIVARPGSAGAVAVCIRAEDIAALPADGRDAGAAAVNRLAARVGAVTPLGPFCRVTLDCGFPLVAHLPKRAVRDLALAPGSRVVAEIEAEVIHVLPYPFSPSSPLARGEGAGEARVSGIAPLTLPSPLRKRGKRIRYLRSLLCEVCSGCPGAVPGRRRSGAALFCGQCCALRRPRRYAARAHLFACHLGFGPQPMGLGPVCGPPFAFPDGIGPFPDLLLSRRGFHFILSYRLSGFPDCP